MKYVGLGKPSINKPKMAYSRDAFIETGEDSERIERD